MQKLPRALRRAATAGLLAATAALSSGCSPELASYDDTYVPQMVEDNYPIKVVERPVRLTVSAADGGLQAAEVRQVTGFAREAASHAVTPVTVAYPAGSKLAKQVARQAAGLLAQQGVARQAILVTPHEGGGNDVTLAFARKTTETKPCGDFSRNLRSNQFNTSGPDFGCAFQQNFAAMIANPEDLQHPQPTTPASSAAQRPGLDDYYSGKWQEPVSDSSSSSSFTFF